MVRWGTEGQSHWNLLYLTNINKQKTCYEKKNAKRRTKIAQKADLKGMITQI
jgi:hypothetical protein